MKSNVRKMGASKVLRFNELKLLLQTYKYLQLTNRAGMTVVVRSKDLLKYDLWLDTDLESGWIDWVPLTWFGYMAHLYFGWYAD